MPSGGKDRDAEGPASGAALRGFEPCLPFFEAIRFPILLLDQGGRCLRVNREAELLVGAGAPVQGRLPAELGPGFLWNVIQGVAERMLGGSPGLQQEFQDDQERTWRVDGIPAPAAEKAWRYMILAQDLTAAVRRQHAADRAANSTAMAALAAGVAHSVRNPLFVLSATLEALDAVHGFPAEAREYLDPLRQQVDRMESVISGLLEFGRPLQMEAAAGWLGEAVWAAVEECRPLAARSHVTLDCAVRKEWARLVMDLPKLTQVFRSLLENAIQHSPRGGTVRLEGHIVPIYGRTWAECRVLDQGSGFAPEALHRLFQPFLGRREGRSGLGLALSQRIVEEHCGQIAAENNPEGGAWVRVRLPLLEADHGR